MSVSDKDSAEVEIAEIRRLIDEYRTKISTGTSSPDNFMSITDMEEALCTLRSGTNNLYTELQSKLVSQIDQNELVRKKKRITDSKG